MRLKPLNDRSVLDIRSARLPSKPPVNDFDPRLHRDPTSPIDTWMAYFNILRSLFGAGMLGMPLVVSQAGMIVGPVIIIFAGCLLIHMQLTLLNCLNEIARQLHIPHISYRYGFRIALLHGPRIFQCIGHRGPAIIAIFMVMSQLGICTVSVTFTTDSLRDIMDWESSTPAILTLLLPYLILEYLMKTLKIVSYVSLLGNFLNAVGLALVFYQIFKDPHGDVDRETDSPFIMLFCFGTALFNLCAVGVVLSLDRALKDPRVLTKMWFGVLPVSAGIPTVACVIFGTLGYWSFGTMEENILRSLPFDETVTFVSIGLYMVAVALTFPIQCYPAMLIIMEVIKNYDTESPPSPKMSKVIELIARPIFVLTSFFICYLVPYQAPFVAFVGNLCTTVLSLIFPAIMELSILYPNQYGKFKIYLVKDLIIVVIGVISWMFGVYYCGYLIYIRILSSYTLQDA